MERIDPSQRLWAQPIAESIPKNSNLYIALDIDVMDPAVVPSVIGPAPGGFSYWQIIEILEAAAKQPKVASLFHAARVRFGHEAEVAILNLKVSFPDSCRSKSLEQLLQSARRSHS